LAAAASSALMKERPDQGAERAAERNALVVVPAPTRWQLRGAVKVVNQALGALSLEKHPLA
jgi:hypothetical protein